MVITPTITCPRIRLFKHALSPTNDSWRVDETYVRVKGKWVYLYRAVDSSGATIDFLLSAKRDAAAAERFLAKALGGENHPAPRIIHTNEHAGYPPAIVRLKAQEALKENCRHRQLRQYLNNVLEQDRRAIKRRIRASQHFRSFCGAWRTIAGYEAIHMIRKGRAYRKRSGGEGRSTPLLHSWFVQRGDGLILRTLSPNFALLQSCNTTRQTPRHVVLSCINAVNRNLKGSTLGVGLGLRLVRALVTPMPETNFSTTKRGNYFVARLRFPIAGLAILRSSSL